MEEFRTATKLLFLHCTKMLPEEKLHIFQDRIPHIISGPSSSPRYYGLLEIKKYNTVVTSSGITFMPSFVKIV
jgi:hypothetical protein